MSREGYGFINLDYSIGGVVQLVRAPACHVGGCGFKPRRSRHFKSPVHWTGLLCINVWDTQSTFSRATETVVFTSAILPRLDERLRRHNEGRNPYGRVKTPWKLIYHEVYESRAEAMRREREIKRMKSREYIERLVRASRV